MEEWASYLARGVGPVKKKVIGANWKCNGTEAQVSQLINMLNTSGRFPLAAEVVVAVPSLHLKTVKSLLRKDISVCSQDVGFNPKYGAFTGEQSAEMLMDSGIKWTLTGHSERRVGFGGPGESSQVVATKTKNAINAGMSVMLCIGEMLDDREAGNTLKVCAEQLTPCVAALSQADWSKVVIAYEPVWAIGTGKVATPQQAEETHKEIRQWIAANVSPSVASAIRIVYGGSVKGNNCVSLMDCPNIDGFLVGGASLLPEFIDIIKCAK